MLRIGNNLLDYKMVNGVDSQSTLAASVTCMKGLTQRSLK